MPEPEVLTITAKDVKPLDVIDEGRFVRSSTHDYQMTFGTWPDHYRAYGVTLEVGMLDLVRTIEGEPPMELLMPEWGQLEDLTYEANDEVRVVRGVTPRTTGAVDA